MKKFFINYHFKIDVFSVGMFLYSLFVGVFLVIFNWLNNEILYALLVLCLPALFVNLNTINKTNNLLHRIFGFRR